LKEKHNKDLECTKWHAYGGRIEGVTREDKIINEEISD